MKEKQNEKLVALTMRISTEMYEALGRLANDYHVSKASVARVAIADNLAKFFGQVQYVDRQQGEEIRKAIADLCTETSDIRIELNRIGVNYNREMALKNIKAKYKNIGYDVDLIQMKLDEENQVKKNTKLFNPDDVKELMQRYEKAVAEMERVLCRIQV